MTANIFKLLILSTAFLMVAITSSLVQSEDPLSASNENNSDGKQDSAPRRPVSEVNVENERLAQGLVQSHLPELKPILKQLKTDHPRHYERAVRDLAQSARKLDVAQKRDERLFDIEVELLKAETQASLLAAKLTVRDHASDRQSLQQAVSRLLIAKTSKARYDVAMYRKRLERDQKLLETAEQRLSRFQQESNSVIKESYLSMLRKAGRKPDETERRKKNRTDTAASPE